MAGPIHLRPATELAERVLLPGDPRRALIVAQALLEGPLMFNHARGLWGYTGQAPDGEPLTVQSTGMGGPSAAVVVEELIELGARRLIRIGTCGALHDGLDLGAMLAAESVIPADGASRALGAEGTLAADVGLTRALVQAGARAVTAVSSDLFYDPRETVQAEWAELGAEVVEMEAAVLLRLASLRGVAAACLLAVSDVPRDGEMRRVEEDELEVLGVRLGELGAAALAASARPR